MLWAVTNDRAVVQGKLLSAGRATVWLRSDTATWIHLLQLKNKHHCFLFPPLLQLQKTIATGNKPCIHTGNDVHNHGESEELRNFVQLLHCVPLGVILWNMHLCNEDSKMENSFSPTIGLTGWSWHLKREVGIIFVPYPKGGPDEWPNVANHDGWARQPGAAIESGTFHLPFVFPHLFLEVSHSSF